ncbi:hypothetical protein [Pedobacter glucosidilyticus]|uniref:hypothetical protein n=1 Tax=Pedobacter glucosidilyticus TaxID=1122941 RepID=UPI0026F2C93E|nr:hypothetical protein [Pedobacter glucosidilyticus]
MNYKTIMMVLGLSLTSASLCFSQAKQSGNYLSEYVEAKTWSIDANRNSKYSDWKKFETRLIDNFNDFKPVDKITFNKYGSDLSLKFKSTGFFRIEKINNRWWIIDPDGYAGTNVSINSVSRGTSDRNKTAFEKYFNNSNDEWAQETHQKIIDLGFNSIGSWSDYESFINHNKVAKKPVSYCIILNFMAAYTRERGGSYKELGNTGHKKGLIYAFDPEFPAFCKKLAKKIDEFKKDPNLFGYFTDNEIPFSTTNLEEYLKISNQNDPNYLAAKNWLTEKGITEKELTPELKNEFMALAAEKYYSAVHHAIKSVDANHLILGTRLYRSEKNSPEFMKVAGKYSDIISINYYGAWTPSKERMQQWGDWAGKPFMITEFYTKGVDTGFPNLSGAGWQVRNQEDRGKAYQNFCLGLLESKNCVGWHWFKYQDNDPDNKKATGSNTDSNKGIVDNDYQFYTPLSNKMKQLNMNRYRLISYFDSLNK